LAPSLIDQVTVFLGHFPTSPPFDSSLHFPRWFPEFAGASVPVPGSSSTQTPASPRELAPATSQPTKTRRLLAGLPPHRLRAGTVVPTIHQTRDWVYDSRSLSLSRGPLGPVRVNSPHLAARSHGSPLSRLYMYHPPRLRSNPRHSWRDVQRLEHCPQLEPGAGPVQSHAAGNSTARGALCHAESSWGWTIGGVGGDVWLRSAGDAPAMETDAQTLPSSAHAFVNSFRPLLVCFCFL
jgi:hypothetical protein